MKIDLQSIDLTQFYVNEHVLNGEQVFLIIPQQMGCNWTKDNKVLRSSVWDSTGELISAGFPKFVNWGEKPEVFPLPTDLTGATIMEKLDGSLLIVSKWKGKHIIRTRGTIDASTMEKNGHEIEIFKQTILPKLETLYKGGDFDTWRHSYLFEWTSPINKIVLNYGDEPEWSLVGIVDQTNYSLETQAFLDKLALQLDLKRPATYTFTTIEDLLANVDLWKGKEGVCVYHHNDQSIHKIKSAWYLALHHMKSELSSFDKVIDVWQNFGRPGYNDFYERVATQFDYELANQIRGDMSRICDAYKSVADILAGMDRFIKRELLPLGDPVNDKKARGQMAGKVFSAYGQTNRASMMFTLLNGKQLDNDDIKRLIYQVLK